MTASSNQNPVLFDLNLYSKRINSANNLVIATLYSAFAAFLAVIVGTAITSNKDFNLIPTAVGIAIVGTIGTVLLWRAERKVTRLSNDEVIATSKAIHDAVLAKYDLDLVDPVVFESRYDSIDGKPFSAPNHLRRISPNPQKALDTVNNRTVEVIVSLSKDNRDVTAFVLTQAPTR